MGTSNTSQEQRIQLLHTYMLIPGIHEIALSVGEHALVACLVNLSHACMQAQYIYKQTKGKTHEYFEEYLLTQLYCSTVVLAPHSTLSPVWLSYFKRTLCDLNLTTCISVVCIDYC